MPEVWSSQDLRSEHSRHLSCPPFPRCHSLSSSPDVPSTFLPLRFWALLLFMNLARHISVLHELFTQDVGRESFQKAELIRSSGTQAGVLVA